MNFTAWHTTDAEATAAILIDPLMTKMMNVIRKFSTNQRKK